MPGTWARLPTPPEPPALLEPGDAEAPRGGQHGKKGETEPSHGNGGSRLSLRSSEALSCPKGTCTPPRSWGVTQVSPGKRRFLRGQEVRSGTLGWGEVGLCGTGPGRSTRMVRGQEQPLRPRGVDTGRECARPITTALSRGRWRGRPRAGRPPGPRPSGSGPALLWAGSQPAGPLAASPGWSSCVDRRGEAGRGSQRREGVVGVQSLVTGRRHGGA